MRDPIGAEVRKARAELFEEAGCDLAELARQLNERAKASGRKVVNRARKPGRRFRGSGRFRVPGTVTAGSGPVPGTVTDYPPRA